jgi:hypothetical protein
MMFHDLLIDAIKRSEIPLRFEPGAEEAVAEPVTKLIRVWLQAHMPEEFTTEFERGQKALLARLVGELEGAIEVPQ